jgi:hypothetical protein
MTAEIPDIVLERYRLRELPPDEAARLADRIRGDDVLRRRLAALDRSDDEIRRSGVLDRVAARMPRAHPAPRRHLVAYIAVPAAVVAAAWAAFIIVPRTETGVAPGGEQGDRIKGLTPALAVYRRTPQGSETLADGAVAHAGDLLRVGYRAAGKPYGVILSIDGRGSVTVHLPPNADRAAALKRDSTVLLDQSYELDDAPQWERFYFVTGDTPFAVAPIVEAARTAAAHHTPPATLALPRGLEQSTFSVQKETRP